MHNLTKIKVFRILLRITYPVAFIIIYPLVLLKKRNRTHLFFFFDRYAIGGAQRIHLDILKSVEDVEKIVFFTRKSPNDGLKETFYSIANTRNEDIHIWCDYLLFRLFSVHYYSFYLNRHKRVHVLSSNSTFFYDMLPFLSPHIHKTELLHNFSYGKNGMEFFGLANHRLLTARIVYDNFTLQNIRNQYLQYQVPAIFNKRILFIEPGVDIPADKPAKQATPLRILYAGRGGPQKRVWLLNKIARHFISSGSAVTSSTGSSPASSMGSAMNSSTGSAVASSTGSSVTSSTGSSVVFHFAGPLNDEIDPDIKASGTLHGEVKTKE